MARIRRHNKNYQANFSLREYGDWNKAMAAARIWIAHLAKNLPPPLRAPKGIMSTRNTSGVVGVFRHRQKHQLRNRRRAFYDTWVARWPECEFRGGIRWSINQFGENDAFALAVLSRRLETIDRPRLLQSLEGIKRTSEYTELLALKR